MTRMSKCVVCFEREAAGSLFCKTCGKSYDRDLRRDDTVAAAVYWAAKRARRFERKRHPRSRRGRDNSVDHHLGGAQSKAGGAMTVKQLRERLEGHPDDALVFLWGMNSSRDDGAGQIEVRCGVDDDAGYAAALIDVEADPDA